MLTYHCRIIYHIEGAIMHSLTETKKEKLTKWRLPQDKNYQDRIKQFKGRFSAACILEHLAEIKKTKSVNTYNLTVYAFRELVKINLGNKHSMEMVNEFLKMLKPTKINSHAVSREKILERIEIKHLLKSISNYPKQKSLIEFLAVSGARISEAVKIKLKDISPLGNDYVEIEIIGKGDKQRKLIIKTDLLNEIKTAYQSTDYLFQKTKTGITGGNDRTVSTHISRQYVFNLLKKYSTGTKRKKAIIQKKITPHTFRHSFGTRAVEMGKPIKAVSSYLGHSDTTITNKFYVHSKLEGESLKDLMEF